MSSASYSPQSPMRAPRNRGERKFKELQHRTLECRKEDGNDSLTSGDFYNDEDDEEDDEGDEDNDEEVFKSRLKMPPYEHAKRKLSQLMDLMNGPYLDLAPHYQRDVVWTSKAMAHLIDSMWKGYYIPPVIFNLELIEDEMKRMRFKRTCVDGKQVISHQERHFYGTNYNIAQRLTSIRKFMNGDFPCWINKKSWYFQKPRGRNREVNVLPESARDEFKSIEILCTEYKGLSERQEIELFQRVQLGKPLSRAEALRATEGGWQEFAKLYETKFANVTNLCKNHRASGFRTTLTCFIQIYEGFNPKAADGIPALWNTFRLLETFCSTAPTLDSNTKSHFRLVFEQLEDFAENDRTMFYSENYTKSQSLSPLSPIELVAVASLISQKGTERPKDVLKEDVVALIARMREVHVDLRMSKVCWITAWTFISTLEHHRRVVAGSGIGAPTSKLIRKPRGPRAPRKIASAPNIGAPDSPEDLTLPYQHSSNAIFGTLPWKEENLASGKISNNPSISPLTPISARKRAAGDYGGSSSSSLADIKTKRRRLHFER